jgi:hypothetical protein
MIDWWAFVGAGTQELYPSQGTPLALKIVPMPPKQRASDAIRTQSVACGLQGRFIFLTTSDLMSIPQN